MPTWWILGRATDTEGDENRKGWMGEQGMRKGGGTRVIPVATRRRLLIWLHPSVTLSTWLSAQAQPHSEPMAGRTPFCSLHPGVKYEFAELESWVDDMTTLFSTRSEFCLQDLSLCSQTSILFITLVFLSPNLLTLKVTP